MNSAKTQDPALHDSIGCLDEESFQEFAPLLAACQEYAKHRRCSFVANDFAKTSSVLSTSACDFDAQIQAAPVVSLFSHRLQSSAAAKREGIATRDQEALLHELDQAFHMVMRESVRNMMRSTCITKSMYPPSSPPAGVDENDCFYEDMSVPFPVVAQRLYNAEQTRTSIDSVSAALHRRENTASFILDFAEGSGVKLPAMPEHYMKTLAQFEKLAEEWQSSSNSQTSIENQASLRNGIARLRAVVQSRLTDLPSQLRDAIPILQDALAEPVVPMSDYDKELDAFSFDLMFYH